jgi:uroporphyrinogen-III decarboxylase
MHGRAWGNFVTAARGGQPPQVPVALCVDSAFVAAAFGVSVLDFLMYPARWLEAYISLVERFPDVVFLPGFWPEYGVATEPSAFGAPVLWRHDQAPISRTLRQPPELWSDLPRPDPHTEGLMALVLNRYWNLEKEGELPEPHRIRFVAARGPFANAAHVFGLSAFLNAIADEPEYTRQVLDVLDVMTETTIRFLQAQLGCLRDPVGVIVIDDTIGMLQPNAFARFAMPFLHRVFSTFEGLIRIFQIDAPSEHLLPYLRELDFELFHFSHRMDPADVKVALRDRAGLMGNLSPRTKC